MQERVHLSGYQARDYEVVDYQMTELDGTGLMFRGPMPKELHHGGGFFACVGAAQTFGCFCQEPFPSIISSSTGLPALNLGYGGAGPEFFLREPQLIGYLNRASFVVLQVMSGRSQSNSLYECAGLEYVTRRRDGRKMGAQRAIDEALLSGPESVAGARVPFRLRRRLPNRRARKRVSRLVQEIRERWVHSNLRLLDMIEVPTVLFWFSRRTPDYRENYSSVSGLFGAFPQLVTSEMLSEVRANCDHYAECVSSRGTPQRLVSRFTGSEVLVDPAKDRSDLGGRVWTTNNYYPSPEMHVDAAEALREVCSTLARRDESSSTE